MQSGEVCVERKSSSLLLTNRLVREQARKQAEMAELQAKYAHLPESVKQSMGIGTMGGGQAGPSSAGR